MTGIVFGGWVGTVIACIGVVFISAVAMRAWYRMDKLEEEVRKERKQTERKEP